MRALHISLVASLAFACSKSEARKEPPAVTATAAATQSAPVATAEPKGDKTLRIQNVRIPKAGGNVHVKWALGEGTAVNAEAPVRVRFKTSEGLSEVPPEQKTTGATVQEGFDVPIKPESHASEAKLVGEVSLVVCDAVDHSICLPVRRALELEFVIASDAGATQLVSLPLPKAKAAP